MRIAPAITLSADQRAALEQRARSRSLPARVVERARIVLLAAEGRQDKEVAAAMKITPKKVSRWRRRFLAVGMAGLERDASRPGRTPKISARFIRRVVRMTTRQKPPNATHWSTRTMAAAVGISEASVRRIWHSHGLKPHRIESFKISNDPEFAEKLEDIVGLYLNPPEHALVLCVDEKSQIQALDRTQPGLPLKRGRSQTLTHDYKRNGGHLVRRPQRGQRRGLRPLSRAASPPRMAQVPALTRPNYAGASRLTPDRRQLRDPQTPQGPALAAAPPTFSYALHTHQRLVAQHGGALLPRSHSEPASPRHFSRSRRTHHGDWKLHRSSQRKPQALHLDGSCLRHLGKG